MAKTKKKQKLAYDPESRAFKDAIHNALTEAQGIPTKSKKPKSQMRDFKSMDDVDRQAKGGILKMRKGGKPAVKPKKPKHSTMLEGERPMPITSQPFFTERFDPSKSKRQNKTSKKSAPTPMRDGGKIDGCAMRGKTRGRYV